MFNRLIPQTQAHEAKYSLTWACSIVEKFESSHARATEVIYRYCGLDSQIMAYLLAAGRPEWQIIKDMVHQLTKWEQAQERSQGKPLYECVAEKRVVEDLLRIRRGKMPEKLWEYLTKGFPRIQ